MQNLSRNYDECRIADLIREIITYITGFEEQIPGVANVLSQVSLATIEAKFQKHDPIPPSYNMDILDVAIESIEGRSLDAIREGLLSAKDELIWRQDKNEFYLVGSDLGEGYKASNLHALLIGPAKAKYHHPDFTLGIFLLAPFTFYRDHFHPAPELYLNLSPRTGWRFHGGKWADYFAGSLIWNAANEVHATRSYDEPFISIFSWVTNINTPCTIFTCGDFEKVEKELKDLSVSSYVK